MTCFFSNIDLPNNKENHLIAFLVPDFNKKKLVTFSMCSKNGKCFHLWWTHDLLLYKYFSDPISFLISNAVI